VLFQHFSDTFLVDCGILYASNTRYVPFSWESACLQYSLAEYIAARKLVLKQEADERKEELAALKEKMT